MADLLTRVAKGAASPLPICRLRPCRPAAVLRCTVTGVIISKAEGMAVGTAPLDIYKPGGVFFSSRISYNNPILTYVDDRVASAFSFLLHFPLAQSSSQAT